MKKINDWLKNASPPKVRGPGMLPKLPDGKTATSSHSAQPGLFWSLRYIAQNSLSCFGQLTNNQIISLIKMMTELNKVFN